MGVVVVPYLHQHLPWSVFLVLAILMEEWSCPIGFNLHLRVLILNPGGQLPGPAWNTG